MIIGMLNPMCSPFSPGPSTDRPALVPASATPPEPLRGALLVASWEWLQQYHNEVDSRS